MPEQLADASKIMPEQLADALRTAELQKRGFLSENDRPPVVAYPHPSSRPLSLSPEECAALHQSLTPTQRRPDKTVRVPKLDARTFRVKRGGIFRIVADGGQVGDLNLFADVSTKSASTGADDHEPLEADIDRRERFFASKTRQLHRSHLSIGDRLWSSFPWLRPMATVIADSLAWYGMDEDGGSVHDVIGCRCDPYSKCYLTEGAAPTNGELDLHGDGAGTNGHDHVETTVPREGQNHENNPTSKNSAGRIPPAPAPIALYKESSSSLYNTPHAFHHCCHSNLVRALVIEEKIPLVQAERAVHDVLNVFMCTGFLRHGRDAGKYFMKRSPVVAGDFLEFHAEMDLLGVLSACPGGDCGEKHSTGEVGGADLIVEVWEPFSSEPGLVWEGSAYGKSKPLHGIIPNNS